MTLLRQNGLRPALSPTGRRPVGIAFTGDSLTDFWQPDKIAWHYSLCALSGGQLRHRGEFSTGGYTLANIENEFMPQVLALNPRPGVVVIGGGTNDLATSGFNQAASSACLIRMIDRYEAAGILPILWLCPPREDNTAANQRTRRWNVYVRNLAHSRGLPWLDFHTPLVDLDGSVVDSLFGDTVHPSPLGHLAMAKYNVARSGLLDRLGDASPYLTCDVADAANLIPSGYGLPAALGGGGGAYPLGWAGSGPGSWSIVPDDTVPGSWMRHTRTAADGAGNQILNLQTAISGVNPGDRLALSYRVRCALQHDTNAYVGHRGSLVSGAVGEIAIGPLGGAWSGIAYCELVVPAATTTCSVQFRQIGTVTGDSTVDISQVTVTNLTALGAV